MSTPILLLLALFIDAKVAIVFVVGGSAILLTVIPNSAPKSLYIFHRYVVVVFMIF